MTTKRATLEKLSSGQFGNQEGIYSTVHGNNSKLFLIPKSLLPSSLTPGAPKLTGAKMTEFQKESTFQRCPHDKKNPYVMVSQDLIRDETISPDCRWLIIYLLSNREGWIIKVSQIQNHLKPHMARQKLYKIINEAIKAGYVRREVTRQGNMISSWNYYVSETPSFSKNDDEVSKNFTDVLNFSKLKNSTLKKEQVPSSEGTEVKAKGYIPKPKKSASPPPPPSGHYVDLFESKIAITEENFQRLVKKFGSAELIDQYAEKLYRWSFNNEKSFKMKKRHDMVIEDWIEKDQKESSGKPKNQSSDTFKLNDLQAENWRLNQEVVEKAKAQCPDRAGGLNWFYKHYVLKDSNDREFDLSGLINHKEFCRLVGKHIKVDIYRAKFPNG